MGLHRAGYEVVGVDLEPQPHYPFEFHQADALEYPLDGFDLVWASPPCQAYSSMASLWPNIEYPELVEPVRERLGEVGCHTIIENVPGAPLRADVILCGSMFHLPIRRHRRFEINWPMPLVPPCDHSRPILGVYGHPHGKNGAWPGMLESTAATWREAMGIDWLPVASLSQAIPPAYSEFLARALQRTAVGTPAARCASLR
jgi:DNA (cytosine-5)-methyltransferase 1